MGVIRAGAGGAAYMRLQSSDIYRDGSGWWGRDYLSRCNSNGLVTKCNGHIGILPQPLYKYMKEKNKPRAVQKYVFFQLDFSVEVFNPWPTVWRYEKIFSQKPLFVFKGD